MTAPILTAAEVAEYASTGAYRLSIREACRRQEALAASHESLRAERDALRAQLAASEAHVKSLETELISYWPAVPEYAAQWAEYGGFKKAAKFIRSHAEHLGRSVRTIDQRIAQAVAASEARAAKLTAALSYYAADDEGGVGIARAALAEPAKEPEPAEVKPTVCTTPNGRTDGHNSYVEFNAEGVLVCMFCKVPVPLAPAKEPTSVLEHVLDAPARIEREWPAGMKRALRDAEETARCRQDMSGEDEPAKEPT